MSNQARTRPLAVGSTSAVVWSSHNPRGFAEWEPGPWLSLSAWNAFLKGAEAV